MASPEGPGAEAKKLSSQHPQAQPEGSRRRAEELRSQELRAQDAPGSWWQTRSGAEGRGSEARRLRGQGPEGLDSCQSVAPEARGLSTSAAGRLASSPSRPPSPRAARLSGLPETASPVEHTGTEERGHTSAHRRQGQAAREPMNHGDQDPRSRQMWRAEAQNCGELSDEDSGVEDLRAEDSGIEGSGDLGVDGAEAVGLSPEELRMVRAGGLGVLRGRRTEGLRASGAEKRRRIVGAKDPGAEQPRTGESQAQESRTEDWQLKVGAGCSGVACGGGVVPMAESTGWCPLICEAKISAPLNPRGKIIHWSSRRGKGARDLGAEVLRGLMLAVCLLALVGSVGGWIALSENGYTIKHNLIAEAGLKVEGDLRVNGVLISKPVANLECNAERAGSVRWNDKFFESCDGKHDWQPIKFCSRECDSRNRLSVPCGVPVTDECGKNCDNTGQGLNMRQCIYNVATTPCNVSVVDMCGNDCGLAGQFACQSLTSAIGGMYLKALDDTAATAAYSFTVGSDSSSNDVARNSLYLTYKDAGGVSQDLTLIRRLNDPVDEVQGMEFAKPEGQDDATFRVSMFAELTGDTVELGAGHDKSHMYFDGVIDKECPFVFDGGVVDGNFTKLCLETPTQQRTLTFPDASGTVITSGNREDIDSLPALTGDNTMVYTGNYRDLADIVPPPPARITCDESFACINQTIKDLHGNEVWDCNTLDFTARDFDMYRVYYVVTDFDSPTFEASQTIRAEMKKLQATNISRMDLAIWYAQLTAAEAGEEIDSSEFDLMRLMRTFGQVNDYERCFTCCCGLLDVNATRKGTCNAPRIRPTFCVGGDNDGLICDDHNPCPGGSCVTDPSMSCFEGDHGFECWDLTQRPNFTTTVNFTAPTDYRRLVFPDASGTIISTGNLEDITSLGVQVAPLVGQSTNSTTTTLQFERCFDDDCGIQQVSSVIKNSTLLVPSAADGILLTTGNLEDVTLDSGSMTGLRIQTDLQINGYLRFGEDSLSSGIRLPPREPSTTYTNPHGGQLRGNHMPGQLIFLVDDSTMVLEFEPKQDPASDSSPSYLTIPAANGTVVTTGNLEAVTKDVGYMTSLSVGGMSYLEGGVTVGEVGIQTLQLVGEKDRSIIFRNPLNVTAGEYADTIVSFQTQVDSTSNIQFPAASGRVITTGNLPDISEFTGELLNVSGASNLRGQVTIGTNRETPIVFSGYVEGDIISRTTPRFEDEDLFIEVPDPNTWGLETSALCKNGYPGALVEDPLAHFPIYSRFDPTTSQPLLDNSQNLPTRIDACTTDTGCGLVVASRYWYGQMRETSKQYLLTAMPSPEASCSLEGWYRNTTCEKVQARDFQATGIQTAYPQADTLDFRLSLAALEIMPVTCGGTFCWDLTKCSLTTFGVGRTCTATIRSHSIGTFLGVGSGARCSHDVFTDIDADTRYCAAWESYPSLWEVSGGLGTSFTVRRSRVCREIEQSTAETQLFCEAQSDGVAAIEFAYFGEVTGICGAYNQSASMCADAELLKQHLTDACVPNGCKLSANGTNVTTWKLDSEGAVMDKQTFAGSSDCGSRTSNPRLVVQARCTRQPYLYLPSDSTDGADIQVHASSRSNFQVGRWSNNAMLTPEYETWVHTNAKGPQCTLQKSNEFDVHWYLRDESTRLTFAPPTGTRTQMFPDVSGRIISTGNLEDINVLQGLKGRDTFVYQHGPNPDDPVTIIDFAAIGTAREERVDGPLPSYLMPDGSSAHPAPTAPNRRITFPDATGTVITSGNTDDLVFKSIQLQGLEMKVEATLGEPDPNADTTYVNFGASSRISGCLNFVESADQAEYTQLCPVPPTQNNQIMLPDESGTILTTGNLLGLPSLRIPDEHFLVGGDATFEGSLEFGTPETTTTLQFYTWIDGDVGLTFSGAGTKGSNVLKLNAPHMGGIDKALRGYLLDAVNRLAVNVQGGDAFRSPVVGSRRINQTECITIMREAGVYEYHDVGYFLISNNLMKTTRLEGTPYAGIALEGSRSSSTCRHDATGQGLCFEGPCACPQGAAIGAVQLSHIPTMMSCCAVKDADICNASWDCAGQVPVCDTTPGSPACAFDRQTDTHYMPVGGSKLFSYMERVLDCPPEIQRELNASNGTDSALEQQCTYRNESRSHSAAVSCVLGMRFATPVTLSLVRIFPAAGKGHQLVGGTIQASTDPEGAGEWVSVFDIVLPLSGGEWNNVNVRQIAGNKYYQVRYVGPPCSPEAEQSTCSCELSEIEFHQGAITQSLSAIVPGEHSYYMDEDALDLNAQGAMVVKCASQKWYPEYLQLESQEMVLPENSGVLLTTGNLRDITKESGAIGSLGVSGDVYIGGNAQIGTAGEDNVLEINALVEGRFPLAFTEAGESGSILTFHVPDPTFDNFLHFPDASGTVITTATLPTVMENLVVTDTATVHGPITMENDVTIGDKINPSTVEINSALSSAFPFSFFGSTPSNPIFTIGVEDPSDDRLLVLPDVSGTVLTTSNMPDVLDSMTFVGEAIFRGETTFLKDSVIFGEREGKSNLDINAIIGGTSVLSFEGISRDNRTISLAVEEPSGHNVITLPDVTGTVITTGNFPDVLESLRVLGTAEMEGEVYFSGPEVRFGHPDRPGKLEVKSYITGRYPLVFSDASAEGRSGSTTFEITPPTANNIISFPDVSGTVITTSNIPTTIMLPDEDYTIQARSFVAKAGSVAMGTNAVPPKHKGSFVFTDASDSIPDFDSKRENSFNVRATGGVKFVSGHTPSGKELGVVLEPGASSWSVLSDRDSKTDLEPVDGVEVLSKLMDVPISTWQYEGDSVKHMGPMAQDFFEAFKLGEDNTRISTIDADGVALASLQGLHKLQLELEAEVEALRAKALAGEQTLRQNEARIHEQNRLLGEQEGSMKQLLSLLKLQPRE